MTINSNISVHYPFITCIRSNDVEYIGIVINLDNNFISMYDYGSIKSFVDKEALLTAGECWWFESNRKIPINIFIRNDMLQFKPFIKTFSAKDITVVFGPVVSLSELSERRVKRKSIQLVKTTRKSK